MIKLQKKIDKNFTLIIEDCIFDDRYRLYLRCLDSENLILISKDYNKIKAYYDSLEISDKIKKIIKRQYKIIKIKQKLALESKDLEEEVGTFFFEKLLKINIKTKLDKELL